MITYLLCDSVSILDSLNGENHRRAYLNSPSGRAEIAADCSPELVAEVFAVWGDVPTVPEPEPYTPTPQEEAQTQLAVLKAQLAATDYQAIKYAEGWLSAEEYAPIRIQRQAWRCEINQLEADLQLNAKSPSPAPS